MQQLMFFAASAAAYVLCCKNDRLRRLPLASKIINIRKHPSFSFVMQKMNYKEDNYNLICRMSNMYDITSSTNKTDASNLVEVSCPPPPTSIMERTFLHEGVLHISEELRGNLQLDSYASLLRHYGITNVQWYSVEDFETFRTNCDYKSYVPFNEIQTQAILMLHRAFEAGASDIHISYQATFGSIRFRCMGMLDEKGEMLAGEATITLIRAIYQSMTDATSAQFVLNQRHEGRIVQRQFLPPTVHSIRVHTEPIECANGQGVLMTLRLLYDHTQAHGTLDNRLQILGYNEQERQQLARLARRTGLTLVAGPTGHGKSTLLKHVIEAQAFEMPQHSFLSIEDPPEYPIHRVSQIFVANADEDRGKAYQQAIAGAMRSDPDVIMIGEVRYPEAAIAAIDAALTGHIVWTTIHAGSVFGVFWRMLSLLTAANFADPMSYLCDPSIVSGMIYQRLVPLLCPHCKISLSDLMQDQGENRQKILLPALPTLRRLQNIQMPMDNIYLRGEGCQQCKGIGIHSLTVTPEIIITDAQLLQYFYQRDMTSAMKYWREEGNGRTSLEQILDKVEAGLVDPVDAENRIGMPLDQGYTPLTSKSDV